MVGFKFFTYIIIVNYSQFLPKTANHSILFIKNTKISIFNTDMNVFQKDISHQAVWYSCVCSDAKEIRRLRLVPAYTLKQEYGFKYRLCLYILDTDYIGRDYSVSE